MGGHPGQPGQVVDVGLELRHADRCRAHPLGQGGDVGSLCLLYTSDAADDYSV